MNNYSIWRTAVTVPTVCVLLLLCRGAAAQDGPITAKVGDPLRKTILNLLRPGVEKEAHQKVIFKVTGFNIIKDWACVDVVALQPGGKPLDFAKAGLNPEGNSNSITALFHKIHGKWKLVDKAAWVTDVEYEDWPAKYHAPKAIISFTQ